MKKGYLFIAGAAIGAAIGFINRDKIQKKACELAVKIKENKKHEINMDDIDMEFEQENFGLTAFNKVLDIFRIPPKDYAKFCSDTKEFDNLITVAEKGNTDI